MTERKCLIVSMTRTQGHELTRTHGRESSMELREVAWRCGVHPELVKRLVSLGLIDHEETRPDGAMLFHREVVPVIRRILRLRNELGVNYAGVGVILELMSRIEDLEQQIRELENRLFP